jgi:tRNA(Arg) A34 adenosine deaminase TadA
MITKNDYRYFDKARQTASISDYYKTHIGCVAVYQGSIIGIGCNCNKTHPIQKKYNKYRKSSDSMLPKLHAEISCINSIKNLDINFVKVKLYIYRIRRDQPFGLSRPCPSCMAAIHDLGIRDIYYATNDGYVYERLGKYKQEVLRNCVRFVSKRLV